MTFEAFRYINFMDVERSVEDSVFPERAIRVLRVIARMNVGGPAIQITGLMTQIPQEEFSQLLVTGYCEEDESDYLEAHDISIPLFRIRSLGRSLNFLHDVSAFFELRKVMKQFRPDIVHTHTAKAGLLGRLASLSTFDGHIRVHTFHGHLLHGYFSNFKTRIVILIERILALTTDAIIAVGHNVKDELLAQGIGHPSKFEVIGPGLTVESLPVRAKAEQSLGLNSNRFNVTWIGRAVKVKAPLRIVDMAKISLDRNLDIEYLVVGDGPLIESMKQEVSRYNVPVTFLGWQDNVERVLAVSDVVLLTSENEGTPVALIQAQMAGLPVITPNVGSASEVLLHGTTGFCEPYSAEEYVNRIRELMADERKRLEFGEAAKVFAYKKFSLQNLIDSHTALYQELINQSN